MVFRCEDLRDFGLVLVPSSSPDYDPLLADIQRRLPHSSELPGLLEQMSQTRAENPEQLRKRMEQTVRRINAMTAGAPDPIRQMAFGNISPGKRSTSAILLNRSGKSIAALSLVWHCEEVGGKTDTRPWTNIFGRALLLPFQYDASSLKIEAYQNTILPGSKRYLGEYEMAGDNADVRMPEPDEIPQGWGGGFTMCGPWIPAGPAPVIQAATLVLDGVFFADGEFAGPGQYGLWEEITSEARVRMDAAKNARFGKDVGVAAAYVLNQIGSRVGEPGEPPHSAPIGPEKVSAFDQWAEEKVACEVGMMRGQMGDERTLDWLTAQADTQLPDFRRV